jgi:hypothetical protein
MRFDTTMALAMCGVTMLAGCGSKGSTDDEPVYAPVKAVDLPDTVQSKQHAVVMRLTDGTSTDTEVYRALNTIISEMKLSDLLTRGGLPTDREGNVVPFGSGSDDASDPGSHAELLAGTSVEQVRAFLERTQIDGDGVFPQEEAVDACGNPQLAAFVPASQFVEAAVGDPTAHEAWPAACGTDTSCDTLESGTVEAFFTEMRADGLMDMVVQVNANTLTDPRTPGGFGHLMGFFFSNGGPGFTSVPLVLNADKMTVALNNLWQQQAAYASARGSREVFAFPAMERTVYSDEVQALVTPLSTADCLDAYDARYDGPLPPHGCSEGAALLVDRNSPAGQEVYSVWMEDGANPANLNQIRDIFYYQLQAAAACPDVPFGKYIAEGPLELVLCGADDGDMWECLAKEDMEEGACRPVDGEVIYERPVSQAEAIAVPTQAYPIILQGLDLSALTDTGSTGTTTTTTYDTGMAGDTGLVTTGGGDTGTTQLVPFIGTHVTLELVVGPDSVLYLNEPERFDRIEGPSGAVQLPERTLNSHCETDGPGRYEIGASWPPGVYTLSAPWSDLSPDLFVHNTSVASWVRYWE